MTSKILTTVISLGLILYFVSGVTVMARNTIEVPFNFSEGWNMVPGFYMPDHLSGGVVEPENILAIYALVPETQQYARLYPNPEIDKLKVMGDYDDRLDYMAQWVYSTKGGAADYMVEREDIPLNTWELYPGWNFVGNLFPEMVGKRLNEFKGNCQLAKSYVYLNAREGAGWRAIKAGENDRVPESVGYGFAVKVPTACKLGIIPSVPPTPAIPGLPE